MKQLFKIKLYFSEIKVFTIFLVFLLSLTIWNSVLAVASIYGEVIDYRLIYKNTLKDAYYYMSSSVIVYPKEMESIKNKLYSSGTVEDVYSVGIGGDISIDDNRYTLIMYEPGLYNVFPLLKQMGADFSKNSEGCILADKSLNRYKPGDCIETSILYSSQKIILNVTGHLNNPYKFLEFADGGTTPYAQDLLGSGGFVLVQATDNWKNTIKEIRYAPGVLFTIKDNASEEEVNRLINDLDYMGMIESINKMLDNSRAVMKNQMIMVLPRPLFNLLASFIAYLSVVILMIRKKEKSLAVEYLCGANRRQCLLSIICACLLVSIIPVLIVSVMILVLPDIQWLNRSGLITETITPELIWIAVLSFVITVIIAVIAVFVSIGRQSPLVYLRGLE